MFYSRMRSKLRQFETKAKVWVAKNTHTQRTWNARTKTKRTNKIWTNFVCSSSCSWNELPSCCEALNSVLYVCLLWNTGPFLLDANCLLWQTDSRWSDYWKWFVRQLWKRKFYDFSVLSSWIKYSSVKLHFLNVFFSLCFHLSLFWSWRTNVTMISL